MQETTPCRKQGAIKPTSFGVGDRHWKGVFGTLTIESISREKSQMIFPAPLKLRVKGQHITIKAGVTRTTERGTGATGVLLCPLQGGLEGQRPSKKP